MFVIKNFCGPKIRKRLTFMRDDVQFNNRKGVGDNCSNRLFMDEEKKDRRDSGCETIFRTKH